MSVNLAVLYFQQIFMPVNHPKQYKQPIEIFTKFSSCWVIYFKFHVRLAKKIISHVSCRLWF